MISQESLKLDWSGIFFKRENMIRMICLEITKGQLNFKAHCQAVNSSKNERMNRVFVRFLEEIEDTKKPFEITWLLAR